MQNKRFEEWLHGAEGFSIRIERLAEDVKNGNVDTIVSWLEAAFDLGASSSEALDALRNAKGLLDTPVGRRRHMGDGFYVEVVRSINDALAAAPANPTAVPDQGALSNAELHR